MTAAPEAPAGRLLRHAKAMRREPTPAESLLWHALRNRQLHGAKFRRQTPLGPYIVDFACLECSIVVEADGATHAGASTDTARDAWLRSQGFVVLRFWNNDIMGNLPGVLQRIGESISAARAASEQGLNTESSQQPSAALQPLPQGEG